MGLRKRMSNVNGHNNEKLLIPQTLWKIGSAKNVHFHFQCACSLQTFTREFTSSHCFKYFTCICIFSCIFYMYIFLCTLFILLLSVWHKGFKWWYHRYHRFFTICLILLRFLWNVICFGSVLSALRKLRGLSTTVFLGALLWKVKSFW